MEYYPLTPGFVWLRRKASGQVYIGSEQALQKHPELYERVDVEAEKKKAEQGLAPVVEKSVKPKSREELGGMSMKAIRRLPDFKSIADKDFKTKEDMVKAVIKVKEDEANKEEKSE